MGKRIRHPKNKKEETKEEEKQLEEKQEQSKHYVLDVHDSQVSGLSSFGQ